MYFHTIDTNKIQYIFFISIAKCCFVYHFDITDCALITSVHCDLNLSKTIMTKRERDKKLIER